MKSYVLLFIAVIAVASAQTRPGRTNVRGKFQTNTSAARTEKPSAPAMTAYWAFDEGRGMKIRDMSGNKNEAEIMYVDDFNPWREGRSNQGLFLNGGKAYVDAGTSDSYHITDAISITAWVMLEGIPDAVNEPAIVSKWDKSADKCAWFLGTEAGYIAAGVCATGTNADALTTRMSMRVGERILNKWMHCAMTFDGTTLLLYLNGRAFGTNTYSEKKELFYDETTSVFIGRSHGDILEGRQGNADGTRCLRGVIDEVRIYPRALSAQEIGAMVLPFASELKAGGKK
ncbi:MAG: LamG domain-containing protein [Spirochaetota bacterium]